jgi:hypothetical protein
MTTTGLIAVAGFLALTVAGFLCYVVIASETDSKPWR